VNNVIRRDADLELLRLVIEQVGEGLVAVDAHGRFTVFNARAVELLARGPEDMEPQRWSDAYDVLYPDGVNRFPAADLPLLRALRGEHVDDEELFVRHGQGRGVHLCVTARPLLDAHGERVGAVAVLRDITRPTQAYQTLERSERGFRSLIDRSPDAMLVQRDGRALYINAALRDLVGYRDPAAIANVLDIVHEDDRQAVRERIERLSRRGFEANPLSAERWLATDGRVIPVETYGVSVFFEGQSAMLSVARDVTERKRTEEALRQSMSQQRDVLARENAHLMQIAVMRERLAQLVVHDLKSPLTVIQANLDMARDRASVSDEEWEAMFADMQRATRRLSGMLLDLIDINRAEEGQLHLNRRGIDLSQLVGDVTAPFRRVAQQLEVILVEELAASAPSEVDRELVSRVVDNIVSNGLRYTPRERQLTVGLVAGRDEHTIFIENEGPVIPVEDRPRLFEKYGQVGRSEGSTRGLGLYLCRLVVEAHGGTISVGDTRAGQGARFEIRLPALRRSV
jgi:PAS domain S-box-containing protein